MSIGMSICASLCLLLCGLKEDATTFVDLAVILLIPWLYMATTYCWKNDLGMQSLELKCNEIGKLAPKIVTESSHSFHLVPRRKGREERAESIPKRWFEHMKKLIHNKVIILFLL